MRTTSTCRPCRTYSTISATQRKTSLRWLRTSCPLCTPFCSSGTTLRITTRPRDLWCSSDRSATRSLSSVAPLLTAARSSRPSRTKSPSMRTKSCLLLSTSAPNSRTPTLSTKASRRTSGRSPPMPCLCVLTPSPSAARTSCT